MQRIWLRRFCTSWIITCRPWLSRQPKPSSMMTLSIGRCCRLAYWPMPSARLTATRNFWLPDRNATLIGRSPVARLYASRSSAFSDPPSPLASPDHFKKHRPPRHPVHPRVGVLPPLPLPLPHQVELEPLPAEQFRQRL